jgi:tetratricopeptide (TPR) repeat protein
MGISFRRRSRFNWPLLIILLIAVAGGGYYVYQSVGVPPFVQTLPFMPKTPTPTPVAIDDGSTMMALADQLWQRGRLEDAATAYEEAARLATTGADALNSLADDFTRQDRPADAAIRRYQAGQALARGAAAYARWARILAYRGWNTDMTAQAVEKARKAVELDPKSSEARAILALAYDRNQQYDAAIQAAREATTLDPNNADAFAFLAEAYDDKVPLDPRAREAVQTALSLNDKSPYAHRNYAYILETEGDYRAAAAEYLKAIALAPALSPFYLDLGRVYYIKLDKHEDAVTALRRATELDPTSPLAHTELGRCFYSKGDYAGALDSLQRATAADPKYATAYGYLGWVYYFGLHQYDKAIPQFQKALELGRFSAGRTAEYYAELGWSYYFMGKCADARPAFQKALDLLASQPDPNIAAQAQNGLNACPAR